MSAQAPGEVLWFGVQDERALASGCSARDIGTDALDRPRFTLSTPDGAATAVRLGICGRHNVMNALAAAGVAFRLGMPPARIGEVLEFVPNLWGAAQSREACVVVEDEYHNLFEMARQFFTRGRDLLFVFVFVFLFLF